MRRLALLLTFALLVGAAAAHAAVPKGTYTGKFSDGGKASLTVKSQKLVKLSRSGLTFKCSDGDKFKSLKATATGDVDVSSGSFDIEDKTTGDGVTWRMTGKFSTKKRKVKGTYRETRVFNDENTLDPDGSITCQTAELTFSAVLPKKK
jgi:hypothetical protein